MVCLGTAYRKQTTMPTKKFVYLTPEDLLSLDELLNDLIGPDLKDELTKRLQEVHSEKLEEYLDRGLEEELAKRLAKDFAKDFAIGFVKGVIFKRIENAIAMKKKGFSTELISEILGMTPEEVEALPTE